MMKSPKRSAITLGLLLAAPAAAQTSEPAERPPVEPSAPDAAETAEEIAQRMFVSGNSLMQAQIDGMDGARSRPVGIDGRVSFFAVPAPEPTVLRKHDLITVIVREESASKSAGKTKQQKEYELTAALREYIDIDFSDLRLRSNESDQAVDFKAEREFSGKGDTDRRDSFVTRITAEVIDVKPNGTLVIQARKRIASDDDEQTFILTGTCRTADITADNTVLSTQLHELNLEKHTKGPVRDATRRGLIPRLIDRISPF